MREQELDRAAWCEAVAGQRIGHMMSTSRGHEGAQDTRHMVGMTTRAGPELNPGQHQNCANKSQGGVMQRTGWMAQQAKQGTE